MIPLILSLKNFLCYGEGVPTLDLEGMHVACLCGSNGHGKSALLDAMTWALWGKARDAAQDELIHQGRSEMMVDLEFRAQDTHYRVTRRHASGSTSRRQGSTDLQLQVRAGTGFNPVTGNSIRETQAAIDRITGMDYDTFINSAFLLQGRADEFTNKTPGERKEVLAKILGLGSYDQLQDRAKQSAEKKSSAASVVEGDLERIRREVARRDGYQYELEVVTRELGGADGRLEASVRTLDALKIRVSDLRRRRGELEEVVAGIPAIEREISDLQSEAESRQGRITAYQTLIQQKEVIEEGLARFQRARRSYEELNSSRQSYDDLTKRKSGLQTTIDMETARLEEQVKQLERQIEGELAPIVGAIPALDGQLAEGRTHLKELTREELEIAGGRRSLHDLAARIGQIEATAERFKTEGQELRSKLVLMENSHEPARCPLCNTALGPEECQSITDGYNAQIEEKRRLYQDNQNALKAAQEKKRALDSELPRREEALGRIQKEAQSRVAVLENRLQEAHKGAEKLEQVDQELAQTKQGLEQGLYAAGEQEQLRGVAAQIEALGYDPGAHQRLYDEMQGLQSYEERHRDLEEVVRVLPQEEESLVRVREMSLRREEELSRSRTKARSMEDEVSELPEWEDRLSSAEVTHRDLEGSRETLFRQQVRLEGELKKIETMEGELEEKERTLRQLREAQGLYQELVEAFGRRGVQAMLIETVLPRIEEEANALLGRMTDNRMHLKLETQRERKTRRGEPIETLEIKISDEMGPRSYELFSGGEAFRINLALRIALSKVLAHRRGAPLPTLFMDEGFGSQDGAGRERILDVIRAIEGDFERILVITHLDEIKEAFPARIEVQKEETGSTFWIS